MVVSLGKQWSLAGMAVLIFSLTAAADQPAERSADRFEPLQRFLEEQRLRPWDWSVREEVPPSTFWIGARLVPLDAQLRGHLELEHGLLVEEVVAEGPADKAGLKPHDVLLQLDGNPIQDIPSLVGMIDKQGEATVEVVVLRVGEGHTLSLTPEKRPERSPPAAPRMPRLALEDLEEEIKRWQKGAMHSEQWEEALRQWQERRQHEFPEGRGFPFWSFKPGLLIRDEGKTELPNNLKLRITKGDDGPARIDVELNSGQWSVTEKEIDQLPESVRPFLRRMLSAEGAIELKWDFPRTIEGPRDVEE
jgi:membrane-associated protease RseP (regulator of RpoE activity)